MALQELSSSYRLVLQGQGLHGSPDELFGLLTFLRPAEFDSLTDVVPEDMEEAEEQAAHLCAMMEPNMLRRLAKDVRPQQVPLCAEVQLPVDMTPFQADCYKTMLARCYETLADPKPAR